MLDRDVFGRWKNHHGVTLWGTGQPDPQAGVLELDGLNGPFQPKLFSDYDSLDPKTCLLILARQYSIQFSLKSSQIILSLPLSTYAASESCLDYKLILNFRLSFLTFVSICS